jgi:hypothetical protein
MSSSVLLLIALITHPLIRYFFFVHGKYSDPCLRTSLLHIVSSISSECNSIPNYFLRLRFQNHLRKRQGNSNVQHSKKKNNTRYQQTDNGATTFLKNRDGVLSVVKRVRIVTVLRMYCNFKPPTILRKICVLTETL